jgi:long-chain acyl-CoA synthetase
MVKRNKFVANAVLYGDRRKFPIMLVVPNFDNLERWARERGLSYGTRAQLLELADVKAKVEREVMGSLHDLAKFETPKKVVLLENDFTIESGELTPTLKVKRRVVERNYKGQIDAAYAADDALAAVIERD